MREKKSAREGKRESGIIFLLNENNHRHRIKPASEKLSVFYYCSRIELTNAKNIAPAQTHLKNDIFIEKKNSSFWPPLDTYFSHLLFHVPSKYWQKNTEELKKLKGNTHKFGICPDIRIAIRFLFFCCFDGNDEIITDISGNIECSGWHIFFV